MAINYKKMFTLRPDGRYQGYWRDELGKRHTVCDRDPEALYRKIQEKQYPKQLSFGQLSDRWENEHRDRVANLSEEK